MGKAGMGMPGWVCRDGEAGKGGTGKGMLG